MKRSHTTAFSASDATVLAPQREAVPISAGTGEGTAVQSLAPEVHAPPLYSGAKAVEYITQWMHNGVCVITADIPGDPKPGWSENKRSANIVCKFIPQGTEYKRLQITGYTATRGQQPQTWKFSATIDSITNRPLYGADTMYVFGSELQCMSDMIGIFGLDLFSILDTPVRGSSDEVRGGRAESLRDEGDTTPSGVAETRQAVLPIPSERIVS